MSEYSLSLPPTPLSLQLLPGLLSSQAFHSVSLQISFVHIAENMWWGGSDSSKLFFFFFFLSLTVSAPWENWQAFLPSQVQN